MPDYIDGGADNRPWKDYISEIQRIEIGNGITSIGKSAFDDCTSLTSVILPSSMRVIGKFAFWGTSNLKNIILPEGLISIKLLAFWNSGLQSISIPASLQELQSDEVLGPPFYGCPLTYISVAAGNPYFCAENNALMTKDRRRLIEGSLISGEYWVPDGVKTIGSYAFYNKCENITTLVLPESLVSIERQAFDSWVDNSVTIRSYTSTRFPDSLRSIGYKAFDGWYYLSYIGFSKNSSLESIASYAFADCCCVTGVDMAPNVKYIGSLAFLDLGHTSESSSSFVRFNFYGDAPTIESDAFAGAQSKNGDPIFICYPTNRSSWTADKLQNYGGNLDWTESCGQNVYRITFDPNGGYNAPESFFIGQLYLDSIVVSPIPSETPVLPGYVFLGWSLEENAEEVSCTAGETWFVVPVNSTDGDSLTLYAVWQKNQDETEDYVIDLYESLTGNAGMTQVAGSTGELNNGKTAIELAYEMYFSEEFLAKNYCSYHFVDALYEGLLSREPEADELEALTKKIDEEGMCWEEAFNEIVTCDEYIAKCQSAGMTIGDPIEIPEYGTYPTGLCTFDGHEESETHVCKLTFVEGYDASCEFPGKIAHYVCEECGALYADVEGETRISEKSLLSGQALGHNYVDGYCSRCDGMDPNTAFYAVLYFPNGGDNEPDTQFKRENVPITLSDIAPTWDDHVFLGWAVSPENSALPEYQGGESYNTDEDLLLYAVWRSSVTPDTTLPSALHTIEEEAFAGCSFFYVRLADDVTSIGSRAFANCSYLKHIYIPAATIVIDEHAFDGVSGLTIHGTAGSYAETFAATYGYDFAAEE